MEGELLWDEGTGKGSIGTEYGFPQGLYLTTDHDVPSESKCGNFWYQSAAARVTSMTRPAEGVRDSQLFGFYH